MKKVEVSIKNKRELVLEEDAKKGDIITLDDVISIDTSNIESTIDAATKKYYEDHFKTQLNAEILKLKAEYEIENLKKIQQISQEKDDKYNKLEINYESLKAKNELSIKNKIKEAVSKYEEKINKLNLEIEKQKNEMDNLKKEYDLLYQNKILQLQNDFEKTIKEKENQISLLNFQKSTANVKITGENLEQFCNNEVNEVMQNGFLNCTWTKDNEVVKYEDETKGSKADFIFKVFADDNHEEKDLLTSVCLDMKDELSNSVNKKKNSDYYNTLDKNRNKKLCKYAVLVSNLEMDSPNFQPIYKVKEFKDMYVVRPGYLITFLNMVVSLTTNFKDLYLQRRQEEEKIADIDEFMSQYDEVKAKYLDKPLEKLKTHIDSIMKYNNNIIDATNKISDECNKISQDYIAKIEKKIENFNSDMKKNYKKYQQKQINKTKN